MRFFDALTGEAFGTPFHGHPDGEPRWVAAVAYPGRLIVASRQSHFDEHPILLSDAGTGAVG